MSGKEKLDGLQQQANPERKTTKVLARTSFATSRKGSSLVSLSDLETF